MKYSFVLIAFNEANTIASCIASITGQVGLVNDYEILVIDDGSSDATPQIVRTLAEADNRVRLLGDGSNHGRGYGRNAGVNASRGDYICMVDADIVLPSDWLQRAEAGLQNHDVAGGIAVPDGDVAYVYRRFGLKPKVVMGSTTITGNNGIYKRAVFNNLNFDAKLRDGEDVDFNHRSAAAGFTSVCVPGLTVEHQEHKSFKRSLQWLYQSGIGASRQLLRFKQVRLPDLAFFAMLGSLLIAIIVSYFGWWLALLLPILAIIGASTLHLRGKFYLLQKPIQSLRAIITNSLLIACYYAGRLVGLVLGTRA